MTSPVSGENPIDRAHLVVQSPPLLPQQKNIVNSTYLVSLGLSVAGLGLLLCTTGLSNPDLKNPHNMMVSSLRFPCLVISASLLCCAEFVNRYFKQMNELEREGPPFLIQEINRQIEERIRSDLVSSEN